MYVHVRTRVRKVPELVPENGDTDELTAEELGLSNQPLGAVFVGGLELRHDLVGRAHARVRRRLARHRQRVHQRLGVLLPDPEEELVHRLADGVVGDVDAGDDLRDVCMYAWK